MIKEPVASRTVLVTGASRGLGLSIARNLLMAGDNVIALARHETKELLSVIAQTKDSGSVRLHFVRFDLSKTAEIPEMVRSLRSEFGPLYGLVNNAAIGLSGALALMHNSQVEELVRVNTVAPIILTKYVVRSMMSARVGRIINIASIAASTGYSGLAVYGATKASMIGFTRSLAREVGRLGITVNAIAPGFLDTDMTHGLDAAERARVIGRSALQQLAAIEDVAAAVEYLLGDGAKSVTGTVLTVDAGATA